MSKWALAMGSTIFFVACSEDLSNADAVLEARKEVNIAVLGKSEMLSNQPCDSTNVGEMVFVKESGTVFVCDGEMWRSTKGVDDIDGVSTADSFVLSQIESIFGLIGNEGANCSGKSVKKDGRKGVELTCGHL